MVALYVLIMSWRTLFLWAVLLLMLLLFFLCIVRDVIFVIAVPASRDWLVLVHAVSAMIADTHFCLQIFILSSFCCLLRFCPKFMVYQMNLCKLTYQVGFIMGFYGSEISGVTSNIYPL